MRICKYIYTIFYVLHAIWVYVLYTHIYIYTHMINASIVAHLS